MSYTTPEVASAARTTLRTIRHWESVGMFGKVARDRRGDRAFTEAQLKRAKVISGASMAGMGLDEIRGASDAALHNRIESAAFFLSSVGELMDRSFDL